MADTTFRNVVNGELVDAASGERYDVVDPTTGEVYATAPMSGQEDLDRAYGAAEKAFEQWGRMTPARPRRRAAQDRRGRRRAGRGDQRGRVQGHRQAARPDDVGGDALRLRPLPLLRRREPGARGPLGRRVHGRPHLVRTPRADRGRRTGDALELPAADDDLEGGSGPRRGQHRRPQAQRHHAGVDDAVRRAVPGVPAARCLQRGLRRPRHRSRAGGAPDPADGRDHRLGAGRHGGRQVRRLGPEEGAPRARRQGPGDRLRRRRHREGRAGDRGGGLLQRRPGLHGGDARARRAGCARRLRGRADRGGQGHQDRHARRRGRPLRPARTTATSSHG